MSPHHGGCGEKTGFGILVVASDEVAAVRGLLDEVGIGILNGGSDIETKVYSRLLKYQNLEISHHHY